MAIRGIALKGPFEISFTFQRLGIAQQYLKVAKNGSSGPLILGGEVTGREPFENNFSWPERDWLKLYFIHLSRWRSGEPWVARGDSRIISSSPPLIMAIEFDDLAEDNDFHDCRVNIYDHSGHCEFEPIR